MHDPDQKLFKEALTYIECTHIGLLDDAPYESEEQERYCPRCKDWTEHEPVTPYGHRCTVCNKRNS